MTALDVQGLIRPAGRLAVLAAVGRLHLGELMVARLVARSAVVVIPRIVAGELFLFVDGGLVGFEICAELTALLAGADFLQSRKEIAMVFADDSHPGHPPCDVCEHPASMLHEGGVWLCTTHSDEARALQADADLVQWTITPAGSELLAEEEAA